MELVEATELAEKMHKHFVKQLKFCMYPRQTNMSKPQYRFSKKTPQGQPRDCYRCGGKHKAYNCKFKEAVCHACKKTGHLARVCTSKQDDKRTHKLEKEEVVETQFMGMYHVYSSDAKPYVVRQSLNVAPLEMEVDTDAARTIVSKQIYSFLWKTRPELSPTKIRLCTYSGQQLVVLGTLRVNMKYEAQNFGCDMLVVKGAGPSMLGRDWLKRKKCTGKVWC